MASASAAAIATLIIAAGSAAYSGYTAAETADYNEKVAKQEAEYQQKKAQVEAQRHLERTQRLMGKQRTGYSSAGISLMSGSVQDVFADTLQESASDMVAIKVGGQAAANKATVQAENYRSQSTSAKVTTVGKVGSSVLSYQAQQGG